MNNDRIFNIPLGELPSGKILSHDLASNPCLLIGGGYGSGKSVFLHYIIHRLQEADPAEVKLILVDFKCSELFAYANDPHLLCPIITEREEATEKICQLIKNGAPIVNGRRTKVFVVIDELIAAGWTEEWVQVLSNCSKLDVEKGVGLIVATVSVNIRSLPKKKGGGFLSSCSLLWLGDKRYNALSVESKYRLFFPSIDEQPIRIKIIE